MSTGIRSALALVALLVAAACSESPAGLPDPTVESVQVTPGGLTLTVGDSLIATALPRGTDGQVVPGLPVAWASENPTIASLTATGGTAIVRAKTRGTVDITAVIGGQMGKITVIVVDVALPVATVQIAPSIGGLEVGKQFEIYAFARAADGTVIGGRTITWQSSDSTIVSIAGLADGVHAMIAAKRAGEAVITATIDGKSATRTIRVTTPSTVSYVGVEPDSLIVETGKEFELNAMLWDATGAPVQWSGVQWYTSDNAVAETKSTSGQRAVLTALRAGKVTITAFANGHTGSAVVTVKDPANVQSIAIAGSIFAGHSLWTTQISQLNAVVYGPGGVELSGHPVAWSVLDPTVAEIRADGMIRGITAGSTTIVAEAGGKRATARLNVYTLPTNGMELALRPSEDELGLPRVAAVVGRTPWTDTDGTTYVADKNLVGGTLNIGKGINGWEQRLEIETVVLIGGTQRRVVAHETIVDRGTFEFNLFEGMNDIYLYSTVTPGFRLHVYFPHPGRLLVPQIIGTSGLINHVYVIR